MFDPSQRSEALKQSNGIMRCFIGEFIKHKDCILLRVSIREASGLVISLLKQIFILQDEICPEMQAIAKTTKITNQRKRNKSFTKDGESGPLQI